MPTRAEIIEADARATHSIYCPDDFNKRDACSCDDWNRDAEAALQAMLPLILEAVAGKVRKQKRGINDWNDDIREQVALLTEGFTLED